MDTTRNSFLITVTRLDGTVAEYETNASTMGWSLRWASSHIDLQDTDTVTAKRKETAA